MSAPRCFGSEATSSKVSALVSNKRAKEQTGVSCTRNFAIPIAANACVTGDDYDFTMNLKERFDLPQGEYTVHLRPEEERIKDICKTGDEPVFSPGPADLTFAVVQP